MDKVIDLWLDLLLTRPLATVFTTIFIGVTVSFLVNSYLGWWFIVPAIVTAVLVVLSLATFFGAILDTTD